MISYGDGKTWCFQLQTKEPSFNIFDRPRFPFRREIMKRRLPAEWEPQDAVLLGWPHEQSDWASCLEQVEPVFIEIARTISRYEKVLIPAPEPERTGQILRQAGCEPASITIYPVPTNDTWCRDFGPVSVYDEDSPRLLDFGFNGWGLKFASDRDNRVNRRLHSAGAFGSTPLKVEGMVLEGGSIDSDGRGTVLTTSRCLLEPNRNPHMNRSEIELELKNRLGADRILWLEKGFLEGDDTDAHIDTLARFCPDNTIAFVGCDDPEDSHYPALTAMKAELGSFRNKLGKPYRLVPLPWPQPCFAPDGHRLPATYANFLIINKAVLVPTYRDKKDHVALKAIQQAFPERDIIGIDCLELIRQHGSLHCVTMQLPKGFISCVR